MALAQAVTRGVCPAKMDGENIPEIGVVRNTRLDPDWDVHFGISTNDKRKVQFNNLVGDDDDPGLSAFGPRLIDVKKRGGIFAELLGSQVNTKFTKFNDRIAIKNRYYPGDAKYSGESLAGEEKYRQGKTTKAWTAQDSPQYWARWSKTALEMVLEVALSSGRGKIHFHLDGLGDLIDIFNKTGNFGYNTTARELRYVQRFWSRFQYKVIFYNGYTTEEWAVMVRPPWIPVWEPDHVTATCRICNEPFSRMSPVRWRHHCRLCGRNVCDTCCANQRMRLAAPVQRPGRHPETGPVRVCRQCLGRFERDRPAHMYVNV